MSCPECGWPSPTVAAPAAATSSGRYTSGAKRTATTAREREEDAEEEKSRRLRHESGSHHMPIRGHVLRSALQPALRQPWEFQGFKRAVCCTLVWLIITKFIAP